MTGFQLVKAASKHDQVLCQRVDGLLVIVMLWAHEALLPARLLTKKNWNPETAGKGDINDVHCWCQMKREMENGTVPRLS